MRKGLLSLFAVSLLFSFVVQADEDINGSDPWQGFNRAMFDFNDGLDRYALKPVAQGYQAVAPEPVEQGISNFFDNLSDFGTMINNFLQGKFKDAGSDLARVTFNSTFGLAGLIDVSTPMGIEKHEEDFGQTLAVWGVESGPYLVLPFFGPSTVRDGISLIPDSMIDPLNQIGERGDYNAFYAMRVIDTRAGLLSSEKLISGDRYTFIRDAYLQKRDFAITDGVVEEYNDDDF